MRPLLLCLLASALLLWAPAAALAVIIDSDDGSGNTTAPAPDPGFDYVGTVGGLTAVYLGDGWVLTANHVGVGDLDLGGTVYPAVPGTGVRLTNGDGTFADLRVYAIHPYPDMPLLPIAMSSPALGTELVLAGNGRNRGAATSWDQNGPPPPGPIGGYAWASGKTLRWGTNHVEEYPADKVLGTWPFTTFFDEGGSTHEAQGANGDSGGAAFALDGGQWELVGIMYAISEYTNQPPETSLYGQATYAADLAFYRDEILDVVEMPEPSGGLPLGTAWVAWLARRRRLRRMAHHAGSRRDATTVCRVV